MVLAGGTHREIGARLFISPKTVEHHVARIRTKLGATNRAEFVAALRTSWDPRDRAARRSSGVLARHTRLPQHSVIGCGLTLRHVT